MEYPAPLAAQLFFRRPLELELDFLFVLAAFVLDVDRRVGWDGHPDPSNLNSKSLALFDAIGEPPQLRDELPGRIVFLDIALRSCFSLRHETLIVTGETGEQTA